MVAWTSPDPGSSTYSSASCARGLPTHRGAKTTSRPSRAAATPCESRRMKRKSRPDRGARRDVADEIEIELLVERSVDCVRYAGEQERVSVGRRIHDQFGADIGRRHPA